MRCVLFALLFLLATTLVLAPVAENDPEQSPDRQNHAEGTEEQHPLTALDGLPAPCVPPDGSCSGTRADLTGPTDEQGITEAADENRASENEPPPAGEVEPTEQENGPGGTPTIDEERQPRRASFDGRTTDFTVTDARNVTILLLEQSGHGRVEWGGRFNVEGFDFDTHVRIGRGWAWVDGDALPTLNTLALITLFDLPYRATPIIYQDGEPCLECVIRSYADGELIFDVPHFTNYSAGANANLTIWDSFEGSSANTSENVVFSANYTNVTSGAFITGATCSISYGDGDGESMAEGSDLYNATHNYSVSGTKTWNVTCSASGYETLNVSDTVSIVNSGPSCVGATTNFTCGQNVTESCTLTTNLTSDRTCFTIDADNVTIDCAGHTISGNSTAYAYGIYSSGKSNYTVIGCVIAGFDVGIYIHQGSGNTLTGLNITTTVNNYIDGPYASAIYPSSTNYLTVANSTLTSLYGMGMRFYNSNHGVVENVTLIANSTASRVGLDFYGSNNNTIRNCTGRGVNGGIRLFTGSTQNLIIDSLGNGTNYGIVFSLNSNNTLINSTGVSTSGNGIRLSNSHQNTLIGSTAQTSSGQAASLVSSENNTFVSVTFTSASGAGINLSSSPNTLFINNSNDVDYNGTTLKYVADATSGANTSSHGNVGWWPLPASNGSDATSQSMTAWYNITSGRNADGSANASLRYWRNNVVALTTACGTLDAPGTHLVQNNVNSSGTCFMINASYVTLDCQGHTINYSQSSLGYGVNISSVSNVTVRNCSIIKGDSGVASAYGIFLSGSGHLIEKNTISTKSSSSYGVIINVANESTINNNTILTTGASASGIYISRYSYLNRVTNNTLATNHYPFEVHYLADGTQYNQTVTGNTNNGKKVLFYYALANTTILGDNETDLIWVAESRNVTITNFTDATIVVRYGNYTITGNSINETRSYRHNIDGRHSNLISWHSALIEGNNLTKSGIQGYPVAFSGRRVHVTNNRITTSATGNSYGPVRLFNSSTSAVSNNTIISNFDGIQLSEYGSDLIAGNNVTVTSGHAIHHSGGNSLIENNTLRSLSGSNPLLYFPSGANNTIRNNYLYAGGLLETNDTHAWNGSLQAGTNIVNGPYLGGNYYANSTGTGYSETCADLDYNGICDSPYSIDGTNVDYLPLALVRHLPNLTSVTLSSLSGANRSSENALFVFNVTSEDEEGELAHFETLTSFTKDGREQLLLAMPFAYGDNSTFARNWRGANGTVVNATYNQTGGVDGTGAYEFDGTGIIHSFDEDGVRQGIHTTGVFTISLWVKPLVTSGYNPIMGNAYLISDRGFYLLLSGENISFWVSNGSSPRISLGKSNIVTADTWHHIVVEGDGENAHLWVDGAIVAIATFDSATLSSLSANKDTAIGSLASDYSTLFNGSIDDVKIFNISLTDEQIEALYWEKKDVRDGLVAEWTFDENSTTQEDTSAYNNTGVASNALFTADGKGRGALIFNGASSTMPVTMSSPSALTLTNGTFSAWARPNGGGNIVLLSNSSDGAMRLYANGSNFYAGSGSSGVYGASEYGVESWYHVVGVFNSTTVALYVNGVSQGSNTHANTMPLTPSSLRIGSDAGSEYFNGTIDEVRIYNRSLDDSEVLLLFNRSYEKHALVADMTQEGDTWSACFISTNTEGASGEACSNTLFITDETPPSITPVTPNGTHIRTGNTNLSATLFDEGGLLNATLLVTNETGSIVHQYNQSFTGRTQNATALTNTTLTEGIYAQNWTVHDINGLTKNELHEFVIDLTLPVVTINSPAHNSPVRSDFIINATITERNLGNVTYIWNGTEESGTWGFPAWIGGGTAHYALNTPTRAMATSLWMNQTMTFSSLKAVTWYSGANESYYCIGVQYDNGSLFPNGTWVGGENNYANSTFLTGSASTNTYTLPSPVTLQQGETYHLVIKGCGGAINSTIYGNVRAMYPAAGGQTLGNFYPYDGTYRNVSNMHSENGVAYTKTHTRYALWLHGDNPYGGSITSTNNYAVYGARFAAQLFQPTISMNVTSVSQVLYDPTLLCSYESVIISGAPDATWSSRRLASCIYTGLTTTRVYSCTLNQSVLLGQGENYSLIFRGVNGTCNSTNYTLIMGASSSEAALSFFGNDAILFFTTNNGSTFTPSSVSDLPFLFNYTDPHLRNTLYDDSLILMYNFDNVSALGENSNVIKDASRYGNDGNVTGAAWSADGRYDGAYYFDGVNDYILTDTIPIEDGSLSVAFWIRLNSTPTGTAKGVFATHDYSATSQGFYIWVNSNPYIQAIAKGSGATVNRAPSALMSIGTWYHYVITYAPNSTTGLRFYRNGAHIANYSTENLTHISNTLPYIIGMRQNTETITAMNGSIDEVRVYNRSISSEEVEFLYRSNIRKYDIDKWELVVNQTNVAPNTAYNYSVRADDLAGNNGTSGVYTVEGSSGPIIESYNHTPTAADDLDPDTTITVTATITDPQADFDTVLLQWRNATNEWNNETMTNTTPLSAETSFTGQFVTGAEGSHQYRVWANDSTGISVTSTEANITTDWDCTWTVDEYFGEYVGYDETRGLFNLTIRNTGDSQHANSNCTLNFRLTHTLNEGRILFDGAAYKPSDTHTIAAKANRTINLSATFLSEIQEDEAIITVNELQGRSATPQRNSTLVLISTTGGPYLYARIDDAPTTLALTPQSFSLGSYLRNIMGDGAEETTAYNVTASWSLPAGFQAAGTELTAENVTDSLPLRHDLNVSFTVSSLATASPGTAIIAYSVSGVNSSGDPIIHSEGRTTVTQSTNVALTCFETSDSVPVPACGALDPDNAPSTPRGSGGSGSFSGRAGGSTVTLSTEERDRIFSTTERYELIRGANDSFTITMENPFGDPLRDITITVSGLLGRYLVITPRNIAQLLPGERAKFTVRIAAPSYFEEGVHALRFDIAGNLVHTENMRNATITTMSSLIDTRFVELMILALGRAEAGVMLDDATGIIDEMRRTGFATATLQPLLDEMRTLHGAERFGPLPGLLEELRATRDVALATHRRLDDLLTRIGEAAGKGLKTTQTTRALRLAQAAFARGDYGLAASRMSEAELIFAAEMKGEIPWAWYWRQYQGELLIGLVVTAFLLVLFTFSSRRAYLVHEIKRCNREEEILLGLIKETQRDCFERKRLSLDEYQSALLQYEEKLAATLTRQLEMEHRKSAMLSFRTRKKRLVRERAELLDRIKRLQDQYLTHGLVETRIYETRMRRLGERVAEIDEEQATMEAKRALRRVRWGR